MSSFINFDNQLTSIIELLAKSAVKDISKLFEDSTLALRLELSHSRREVVLLERKLQFAETELQAARSCADAGARGLALSAAGLQPADPEEESGETRLPPDERSSIRECRINLVKIDPTSVSATYTQKPSQSDMQDCLLQTVCAEDRSESLFIKDEANLFFCQEHKPEKELSFNKGDAVHSEEPVFELELPEEHWNSLPTSAEGQKHSANPYGSDDADNDAVKVPCRGLDVQRHSSVGNTQSDEFQGDPDSENINCEETTEPDICFAGPDSNAYAEYTQTMPHWREALCLF
ncbi:zinc finger protein 382-like isoform X1 [Arapaima gigas]